MDQIMDTLCSCYIHSPKQRKPVLEPQFVHRLNLSKVWSIQPGDSVLDVGCGQGDSALVLAYVVGPTGHVTGLDPAPLDYGSPYTLGQAQAFIRASELGGRVDFRQADAPGFLTGEGAAKEEVFDAATMCHSLWYFSTRESVLDLFRSLAGGRIKKVCLAEYTAHASKPEQVPHELAARVQKLFHALKKPEEDSLHGPNVREALEPAELIQLAEQAGWKVKEQGVVEAAPGMLDGSWETQAATDPSFRESVLKEGLDKEKEEELLAYIPKIEEGIKELKSQGKTVVTMDVAWVVLELI